MERTFREQANIALCIEGIERLRMNFAERVALATGTGTGNGETIPERFYNGGPLS